MPRHIKLLEKVVWLEGKGSPGSLHFTGGNKQPSVLEVMESLDLYV